MLSSTCYCLCHGGVIALRNSGQHRDSQVETREDINREEKIKTAEYDRGNYWRRSNGKSCKVSFNKRFPGHQRRRDIRRVHHSGDS